MKITKNGTVFQLTFMPRLFPVNCYLVEEEQELTLIDAALSYSGKGILHAAKLIGKPITRIVITHAHDDHVGALDTLKQALPDVPVSISTRDSLLFSGDVRLLENEATSPIRGGVPKRIKTRPDSFLQEGDRIGSLEVIASPGHTPGSIALLDTRNRSLVAGDAFQTRGGAAVAGVMKPFFPFPAFGTWDKATSLQSAKKLQSLNPSLLAIGHGKMMEQPNHLMKKAIIEAEQKLYQGS
ncbi:MBL fold metallo-hydrolase [Pseudobacillus wudalianchiensis]|uniref:Metallo-beta-lactamase domain-containing protein n=1 Tax=Pseudobacillus wudalianchiensis TaxID=1743143 RepID=A0A1B9AG26_9BACI|nr:MBL fold metallo-hydrolase [Bacillus wudalianchiensis]OCA82792.1 hypothetical protein A8F95_13705 [Bacillus wudalianchiensis]